MMTVLVIMGDTPLRLLKDFVPASFLSLHHLPPESPYLATTIFKSFFLSIEIFT